MYPNPKHKKIIIKHNGEICTIKVYRENDGDRLKVAFDAPLSFQIHRAGGVASYDQLRAALEGGDMSKERRTTAEEDDLGAGPSAAQHLHPEGGGRTVSCEQFNLDVKVTMESHRKQVEALEAALAAEREVCVCSCNSMCECHIARPAALATEREEAERLREVIGELGKSHEAEYNALRIEIVDLNTELKISADNLRLALAELAAERARTARQDRKSTRLNSS